MPAVLDAIEVKKTAGALPDELIERVVADYVRGEAADEQMSALLMAILLQGMSFEETLALTRTMADSGPRYAFPDCVDKHSTGGVGDKVTLTAMPIVAACGVKVAKLSGRGLGITGGTIDKLESIPGLSTALSEDAFRSQVESVGLAIGEAGDLAPADKAIYALRDTTGTVDSMPLIGSSIVSKKAATGAGHLLYDVKCGSGAFMKTLEDAEALAGLLVRLSAALGITASAVITDMGAALGQAVGNALEVRESVAFLRGEPTSPDLDAVARDEARRLLELAGEPDAGARVDEALAGGAAHAKLREVVTGQGGDADALEDLPVSGHVRELQAPSDGHVARFDALGIARASLALGAGRRRKDDSIDPGAGVEVLVRVGDEVGAGQPVARLYGDRDADAAEGFAREALELADAPVTAPPHLLGEV